MENPFATNAPDIPRPSLISTVNVPNVFPIDESVPYRLAICGEAPGSEEETQGVPFIGASGRLLDAFLSHCGVLRSACFIGNVCQHRPPGNDINEWGYEHEKVLLGWEVLQRDLRAFSPNCILALGNTPLHFLCGRTGISNWRGSILGTNFGKVVPSIHPAFVLREYREHVFLRHDILRARVEAESPELHLPQRTLELDLSANEICNRLDNWPAGQLLSFDIEGGLDSFPCCSVAAASNCGFIIAWSRHTEPEQARIAVSLSRVLYRVDVPKVLQNSLYDRFVLAYGYRMLIRNVVEDTMDKSWAIFSELKKSLGTIASIWTQEPYYKFERKTGDERVFWEYCIKDSCVTLEACKAMDGAMSDAERRHYTFNVALKNPLLYMQLRGIRYDSVAAETQKAQVHAAMLECATRIELQVQPMQFTKKEFSNCIRGEKGCIGDKRLKMVLYDQKGYPQQKKGRGPTARVSCDAEALLNLTQKRPNDSFLSDILLHRKLESVLETLEWLPDPRDGRIKCSYNQFSKGEDEEGGGATETGRLRCSKSLIPVLDTTVGGNLQTVTKKLRYLYKADQDHWLFQADLAGADGWTVAAHCMKHGDHTMWDDYMFGLKPAKIIALMYTHGAEIGQLNRKKLKQLADVESAPGGCCDQDSWLYFACKRIQHASNYGVTEKTVATQIMKDSYKMTGRPVFVEPSVCGALQRLYFMRYPGLYQWHNDAKTRVMNGENLTSASGHTRKFFGRRKTWNYKTRGYEADHDTWKEWLADEPQENTTYATNLALYNLWNDPRNRNDDLILSSSGLHPGRDDTKTRKTLWIEPLHQVHDALIGQFPKERTEWAIERIRTYFQNPLTIANTIVTIPFEGAYGPSWGELGPKHGGGVI